MFSCSTSGTLQVIHTKMLESPPSGQSGIPKVGVCKYFAAGKHCRFGDICKWHHDKPDRVSENTTALHEGVPEAKQITKSDDGLNAALDAPEKPKDCNFFKRHGRCRFGARCRFLHSSPPKTAQKTSLEHKSVEVEPDEIIIANLSDDSKSDSERPESASKNSQSNNSITDDAKHNLRISGPQNAKERQIPQPRQGRICRFFKVGKCTMGDGCRFRHPSDFTEIPVDENGSQRATGSNRRPRQVFSRPTKNLSQISEGETKKLRETEIQQLQKRFTKSRIQINEESSPTVYRVVFSPTDPDWPYDVKDFEMEVSFPEDYPKQTFHVVFPADQNLPEIVTRHLNRMVANRVTEMHTANVVRDRAVLIFRPFLQWLDKNLEEIFTEGARKYKMEVVAKAAGFEFIPSEELRSRQAALQSSDGEMSSSDEVGEGAEDNKTQSDTSDEEEMIDKMGSKDYEIDGSLRSSEKGEAKGTEIRLRGLELTGDAATLNCTKIFMSVQCCKCKAKSDVRTTPGRVNSITCSRCANQQLLAYRSKLMHQYSSVMGYLDLQGCLPFDVITFDSEFNVGCLNCSKEMNFTGLPFGQPKDMWCKNCHKKMKIVAEAVRFMRLEPSEPVVSGKIHVVDVKKGKKVIKDPAIQEGKPLPAFGTCKHYKKSFRWLRFPCCGKAYPCDVCHDAEEDHEFKFANRMICGHCAKEQPYAGEKLCVSCESSMTKSRTAHWEGGQGCRNKSAMSKLDKQKYSNSNKTVSRKQQTKQQPAKKK